MVVGLHVLVAVVDEQVGVAGFDRCLDGWAGHAGLLAAAGIERRDGGARRLGGGGAEREGPGRVLAQDRLAALQLADCLVEQQHAAPLLFLAFEVKEAVEEPLRRHGGHGLCGC